MKVKAPSSPSNRRWAVITLVGCAAVVFAVFHDRRKAKRQAAERARASLDDTVPSDVDAIPEPLERLHEAWSDTT